MLEPEARHLLTDALRPPETYRLDLAIATTYTLDLNSLILAPLAMAAHDQLSRSADAVKPDPLVLLESVRRHANRTTVFVQAGAIHVPSSYQRILAFAEGCVVEVATPNAGRVFHPKIWVLRFVGADGDMRHRFLCSSRNLTADRSWDTILQLDQAEGHDGASPDPLVHFLEDLPGLASKPLPADRQQQLFDLTTTLRTVTFEVPAPFTSAQLWPLGTASGRDWPFPKAASDLVVISPFLDRGFLKRMPSTRETRLVSRAESFEQVGANGLPDATSTWVLEPAAETEEPDESADSAASEEAESPVAEPITGLHAKVFVWDAERKGSVFTGSANATSAAFGGNVEFSVLLTGPSSSCGVAPLLTDSTDVPGLVRLLQPYEIVSDKPQQDPRFALEREIEQVQAELAMGEVTITANAEGDDYALTVTTPRMPARPGLSSTLRPLGLAAGARLIEPELVWRPVAIQSISPFVVLETTLTRDGVNASRSCVIKGTLAADPSDRQRSILRSLLSNERAILRYLALLLGDPAFDSMIAAVQQELAGAAPGPFTGDPGRDDLILFEPLIRAAGRQDGSLDRVEHLFAELRDDAGHLPHLSAEFEQLWSVVWDALKEKQP